MRKYLPWRVGVLVGPNQGPMFLWIAAFDCAAH